MACGKRKFDLKQIINLYTMCFAVNGFLSNDSFGINKKNFLSSYRNFCICEKIGIEIVTDMTCKFEELLRSLTGDPQNVQAFETCFKLIDFSDVNYDVDSLHIIGKKNLSWLKPILNFTCPLKSINASPCMDKKVKLIFFSVYLLIIFAKNFFLFFSVDKSVNSKN